MNKKELAEIRKNFSETSDLFVLNHVATAFVDSDKNIRCQNSRAYHNIPSEESECLMATLKRVLAGTLGKGLLEYEFPNEAYEEGGSQAILYEALNTRLEDENAVTQLMEQVVHNMDYISTYAVLVGHCTYTVFQKSKSDEIDPYQSHEYHFLITAICPVEVRVDGLIYNEDENAIEKKNVYDRIVAEIPTDGFLYPTFTGRGPDVNHVLYSAHKPKDVNISIVERVLGCNFTQTAQEQKETFQSMMQEIVADELSYSVITGVNEKLRDIAAEYANEPDLPIVDDIHVRDILLDSGVSQEKAEEMQMAYREATHDKPITVNNLVENKTTISMDGITVSIGKDATDKVRTQCVNGRRYLLIDLDDPAVEINGLTARVAEQITPSAKPEASAAASVEDESLLETEIETEEPEMQLDDSMLEGTVDVMGV